MVNVKIANTSVPLRKTYTNSADPDQTASEEAVLSGSSQFAIYSDEFYL